jgi:hypothetical protein
VAAGGHMFGAIDFLEVDDGWRNCEKCREGFTLWYERVFDNENQNNGWHEKLEMSLCEKCYEEANKE